MRPPAASTNRRVSVAMPDSRCRKLSAVRSAVSSAPRGPSTSAIDVARRRSGRRRRADASNTHGRIELAERLARDVEAGDDAAALGEERRRARAASAGTVASVVTSPAPTILGQRAPHEVAIERRVERRERHGSCASRRLGARARRELAHRLERAASAQRRTLSPASTSRATERPARLRRRAARCTPRDRRLRAAACFATCFLRIVAEHLARASSQRCASRDRRRRRRLREQLGRASATPRDAPTRRCHHDQTSSVTNGRNGANSRSSTDSAASSAALADAGRRRRPGRRSGAPSPARGSRRRSTRRTSRSAAARARSRSASNARVASSTSAARLRQHRRDRPAAVIAPVRLGLRQHELRRVQQLDRQPPADLHLAGVERRVGARAGRSPPSSARRRSRAPRAAPSA